MRRAVHAATVIGLGMAMVPLAALAQVSPVGGHHVSLGGGNGLNASVSASGGFDAAVPLDLPQPRGSVPLPLSVVYTGASRVGAAGLGWDIPLSYVRLSDSTTRRKPGELGSTGNASPPRLVMVMSGASSVMVPGVEPGTFTPMVASSYTKLEREGADFFARDSEGRRYRFVPVSSLSGGAVNDDTLWLLREIHAPADMDKVVLDYRIDAEGCYAERPQILLDALRYTFDASGRDALFTVDLRYQTRDVPRYDRYEDGWVGMRCKTAEGSDKRAPMFLSVAADAGRLQSQTHWLQAIDVVAFDNTGTAAGRRIVRAYEFTYRDDPDTGLPRLSRVDRWGEYGIGGIALPDAGDAGAASLPVATYEYESATQGTNLAFKSTGTVKRSFGGADYADELSGSEVKRYSLPFFDDGWVELTRTTHVIRDFNGDGLPDLVFERGGRFRMISNVTTSLGATLASGPEIDLGKIDIHLQSVRFDPDEPFLTTETWVQYVDWNQDGRLDIVDARYGKDKEHWLVYLNRPHPTLGPVAVEWQGRQVFVGNVIRNLTEDFGHAQIPLPIGPIMLNRWPLSRSRTWQNVVAHFCRQRRFNWSNSLQVWVYDDDEGEQACADPEEPVEPPTAGPTDSITEFALADVNGDGYLDFTVNDRRVVLPQLDGPPCERGLEDPAQECPADAFYPTWFPDPLFPEPAITRCHCSRKLYTQFEAADGSQGDPDVYVLYNTAGARFPSPGGGVEGFVFGAPYRYGVDDAPGGTASGCGVEWWQTEIPSAFDGNTQQRCAFGDANADGVADYAGLAGVGTGGFVGATLDTIGGPLEGPSARFETNRDTVCADGEGEYYTRQTIGYIDLTRDGVADRVARSGGAWTVAVGTGTGFQPPIPIVTDGYGFELSLAIGACGKDAVAVAGITDLDGDGAPELLRIDGAGELAVQSIVGSDGSTGALSAGRLTVVGNGYGARTRISYRSAKTDRHSDHFVPMPEIVVGATQVEVDGRAPGTAELAPALYAYGHAQMTYDPVFARFRFAGYRRRVVLHGVLDRKEPGYPLELEGFATIEDYAPAVDAGSGFRAYALSGTISRVSRLAGWFPPDPSALLPLEPRDAHQWVSETTLTHEIASVPHDESPPAATDECLDRDPYGDPSLGGSGGTAPDALCRSAAVVYTKTRVTREGETWEGTANVTTATAVEEIDAYGRPLIVRESGDVRRPDDDRCIVMTYASPVTGELDGVSIPHSVRTTNCGATTHGAVATLQGVRYGYDGLPSSHGGGQVKEGLVTQRIVERYDPQTGELLDEQAESFAHDGNPFGRVARVFRERVADGTTYSQQVTFLYDRFGLTPRTVTTTATDAATLVTEYITSTFPSIRDTIIGANGERTHTYYDHFARPVGTSVIEGGAEYALDRTLYRDGPVGRRVRSIDFPDATPWSDASDASAGAQVADTHLDGAGRVLYNERQLGSNYGGSVLIAALAHYDAFSRPAFVADPFEAEAAFAPGANPSAYGTTTIYDDRGRVRKSVRAGGQQSPLVSTHTSFADQRYATTYQYLYKAGELVTRVRGPNENLPGKPQYGAYRETRSTAIGWTLEETYMDAGAALERTRYDYDRLGRQLRVRRYPKPASISGPVIWETRRDSLGNVLTVTEPGTTPRQHEYDAWGNLTEVWWMDGPVGRVQAQSYDGLGRVTRSRLIARAGLTESLESSVRYHYDAAAPGHADATRLLGRLAYVEADGVMSTFFSYDELGRQAWVLRDPAGDAPEVRQSQELEPSGRTRSLGFAWDDRSEEVLYAYDSAGRIVEIAVADGASRTLFQVPAGGIDGLGRYTNIVLGDAAGAAGAPPVIEENTYAETGHRELIEQRWTTADRVIERRYHHRPSDGMAGAAQFDATGRVRSIEERHDFYAPSLGVDHEDVTVSSYDPLGRLTRSTSTRDGALRRDESFTHDPLGNLLSRVDHRGKDDWTFRPSGIDPDRLCRAYRTPALSGPVLTPRLGVGFLTVGNPNAIVRAVPLCTHVYDGGGNVTRIAVTPTDIREFSYDSASRLIGMRRGGMYAELGYDGLGGLATLKVANDGGGVHRLETRYGSLVERRLVQAEARHVMVRRIPGPTGIVAELRSDSLDEGIIYFHGDHTANRWFTNEDGAVVQEVEYGPFGRIHGDTAIPGSLTETHTLWNGGDALSDFGITRLGARIYNPLTGRFLQRDPISLPLGSIAAHPYTFAFGDPVNLTDYTGLNPFFDFVNSGDFKSSLATTLGFGAVANARKLCGLLDRCAQELPHIDYATKAILTDIGSGVADFVADNTIGLLDASETLGNALRAKVIKIATEGPTLEDVHAAVNFARNPRKPLGDAVANGVVSTARRVKVAYETGDVRAMTTELLNVGSLLLGVAGAVSKAGAAGSLLDDAAGGARSAAQAERLRLSLAADEILTTARAGSGLKADSMHRAASFVSREQLEAGKLFNIRGGDGVQRHLLQTTGEVNGRGGIFEFIVDPSKGVTHQRFIPGGRITGAPNQRVP